MTQNEALRLALEALEKLFGIEGDVAVWRLGGSYRAQQAITAIKAALEAKDEPVAWGVFECNLHDMFFTEAEAVEMAQLKGTHAEVKPLYAKEST